MQGPGEATLACDIVVNITTKVSTRMDKSISAADANRRFSELLRTVKAGHSVIVTSHGKPAAKITPLTEDVRTVERARSTLFNRLRKQRAVDVGRWTRDELYDDVK